MVFDWERFREEIRFVQIASFPDNSELAISHSVSDPVVAHGGCLELLDLGPLVDRIICSGVVGYNSSTELCVSPAVP